MNKEPMHKSMRRLVLGRRATRGVFILSAQCEFSHVSVRVGRIWLVGEGLVIHTNELEVVLELCPAAPLILS